MADAEWWYNSDSGSVSPQSGFLKWFNDNLGINDFQQKYLAWHGPFKSKQDIFQYYLDNKQAHPGWHEPTDSLWQSFKNSTGEFAKDVGGETADILGFGGGSINAGNWFIRIGEILLGIVLIGVGVAKMTGTTNAISNLVKARI